MRTDAKIGFAIGGVLLAVVVVYLLVVPRHHAKTHQTVALVTPPANATPTAPPAVDLPPPTVAETPTTAPALAQTYVPPVTPLVTAAPTTPVDPTLAVNTPAAPAAGATHAGDDWNALLHNQPTAPGLMATDGVAQSSRITPSDNATSTPPAVGPDLVDNTDTGHKTSGSLVTAPRGEGHDAGHADAQSAGRQYKVRSGETLSSIAADVYGNSRYYLAIMRANPTINPNRLKVGTKLTLPAAADVKTTALAKAGHSPGSDAADATASSYDSSAAAGGGVILASVATPPTDTVLSSSEGFYTVKKGDTLYRISKKLYGNLHEADVLYTLNKTVIGPDKAKLKLGTVLQLPSTGAVEAVKSAADDQ